MAASSRARRAAWRILETSHPPTYYLPRDAFEPGVLRDAPGASWCEWKGRAAYFDLVAGDAVARQAAWTYPHPTPAFAEIAGRGRRDARPGRPVHRRRRDRPPAAGRVLRRVDHQPGRRAVQGRARHRRLVAVDGSVGAWPVTVLGSYGVAPLGLASAPGSRVARGKGVGSYGVAPPGLRSLPGFRSAGWGLDAVERGPLAAAGEFPGVWQWRGGAAGLGAAVRAAGRAWLNSAVDLTCWVGWIDRVDPAPAGLWMTARNCDRFVTFGGG